MNPFQKNKVDISALSPEEQKAFRLYGKLPNRKDVLQNKLKERKYFDSGDYALSKAGKTSEISPTDVGREHPVPENIPHLSSSPSTGSTGSATSGGGGGGVQAGQTRSGSNAGLGGGPVFAPGVGGLPLGGSPVKESSWLQRETSMDDVDDDENGDAARRRAGSELEGSVSPVGKREGVPIRNARPGS